MISVKFNLFLQRLLALIAIGMMTAAQASAQAAAIAQEAAPVSIVSYDKANDFLHVSVEAVALKRVLGRIAKQSGIEVMFDDMADAPVSVDIKASTLEDGLKRILKGHNHMLRYSRDEQEKLLLIGVMVLPEGEQDTGRARRLVGMEDEAFYRARNQLSIGQVQQMDRSMERWQARMSELSPERRQRLEKKTAERIEQQLKANRLYAQRMKKIKQKEVERNERRLKQRELALKRLDPEQRAAFERDSQEARERMQVILQQNENN